MSFWPAIMMRDAVPIPSVPASQRAYSPNFYIQAIDNGQAMYASARVFFRRDVSDPDDPAWKVTLTATRYSARYYESTGNSWQHTEVAALRIVEVFSDDCLQTSVWHDTAGNSYADARDVIATLLHLAGERPGDWVIASRELVDGKVPTAMKV